MSLSLGTEAALDLTPLANLPALWNLHLYAARILDPSPLTRMASLRQLYLGDVKVSIEEVEDLRESRPDLKITARIEDYGSSDQPHAREEG